MAKKLNHYNRIAAIFFIAVGLFFSFYGRTVEVGTWNEPGPGFMPFWTGLTLAVMAFFLFLGSFRKRDWPLLPDFFPRSDSWKRVLMAFFGLIAYLLLFQYVGFTLTTFFFVLFLVKCVFPQSWTRSLVTAFLTAILARLLFVNLLETQLPKGFFGF